MLGDGSGFCDAVFLGADATSSPASARPEAGFRVSAANSRPPSYPRANADSRPRRRAAPSSRLRAQPGPATGSTAWSLFAAPRWSNPVAVEIVSAAHAVSLAPGNVRRFLHARGIQLDFRRRPPGAAQGKPTASAFWPASRLMLRQRRSARWKLPSTISAAPPSALISPACATKRSIRGCSGHDAPIIPRRPRELGDPVATGLSSCKWRRPFCLY